MDLAKADSPVSNNGRGLKPNRHRRTIRRQPDDSPVSNNGRGLKHRLQAQYRCRHPGIRPLAITGVD